MDLYCPKCGEPWDNDVFHDAAEARQQHTAVPREPRTYPAIAADFRRRGCAALSPEYTTGPCRTNPDEPADRDGLRKSEKARVLYDLLGDDMDGAASMLDDV